MDINEEKQKITPILILFISIKWILLVSISPIVFFAMILTALFKLLQFFFKALLLFIIVAIYTPFAMMYNMSLLRITYILNAPLKGTMVSNLCYPDPRTYISYDIQVLLSDFLKVTVPDLLVVMSTGIITFYTAPRPVFYISIAIWLVAIFHKWLNTDSLSKTAFSCLCGGYGLNPMMIFFSFIGLFDIGGHPIAKCSFIAKTAYMFVQNCPNQFNGGERSHPFEKNMVISENTSIQFDKWDAFSDSFEIGIEEGLFQLSPKINIIKDNEFNNQFNLESSMVLKLFRHDICEYPMERVELPVNYSKIDELYNFLVILSKDNGFVTNKMEGRYQSSLTLLQIAEGVQRNDGYKTIDMDITDFVVARCTQ